MGWKEYAETLGHELALEQRAAASLRYRLAEKDEELASSRESQQVPVNQSQQIAELVATIAKKDKQITHLGSVADEAQTEYFKQKQQTVIVQKLADGKVEDLKEKLRDVQKQLASACSGATTAQVDNDLTQRNQDLEKKLKESKSTNERLMKQLQQEKAANVGKLAFMAGNADKRSIFGEDDDEEPLPYVRKIFSYDAPTNLIVVHQRRRRRR